MWFIGSTQVTAIAAGNISPTWTIVGTGDFNGDGMGDILWRNANGTVAVWLMTGGNLLSAAGLGNVPADVTVVGTSDFNGDGLADNSHLAHEWDLILRQQPRSATSRQTGLSLVRATSMAMAREISCGVTPAATRLFG